MYMYTYIQNACPLDVPPHYVPWRSVSWERVMWWTGLGLGIGLVQKDNGSVQGTSVYISPLHYRARNHAYTPSCTCTTPLLTCMCMDCTHCILFCVTSWLVKSEYCTFTLCMYVYRYIISTGRNMNIQDTRRFRTVLEERVPCSYYLQHQTQTECWFKGFFSCQWFKVCCNAGMCGKLWQTWTMMSLAQSPLEYWMRC
jgi:hypothetical protein